MPVEFSQNALELDDGLGLHDPVSFPSGHAATEQNDLLLPADPTTLAIIGDLAWIHEQKLLGAFESYRGEFVAVADRRVLEHDGDRNELRRKMTAHSEYPESRYVTSFIEPCRRY